MRRTSVPTRRAFSLVEVSLVVIIIAVLGSILLVAVRSAMLNTRLKGEAQLLTNLQIQISHFKSTHGFVPPLVRDAMPVVNDEVRVWPKDDLSDEANLDGLYSELSLPYYLLGALPKEVDGVDGFGCTKPLPPVERTTGVWVGPFSRRGAKLDALADVTRDRNRVRTDAPERVYLLDRWNRPIRYYRWENEYHASGNLKGEIERFNIPSDLWPQEVRDGPGSDADKAAAASLQIPQLKSASYAILSLGPDGRVSKDDLVEYER